MDDGVDDAADPNARRRRRRRTPAEAGDPEQPAPPPAGEDGTGTRAETRAKRRRPPHDSGERGLRDIVGAGPSQVGVSGALRARDVNRPSAEDLAEAEANLAIVRRNWQPPTTKPGGT